MPANSRLVSVPVWKQLWHMSVHMTASLDITSVCVSTVSVWGVSVFHCLFKTHARGQRLSGLVAAAAAAGMGGRSEILEDVDVRSHPDSGSLNQNMRTNTSIFQSVFGHTAASVWVISIPPHTLEYQWDLRGVFTRSYCWDLKGEVGWTSPEWNNIPKPELRFYWTSPISVHCVHKKKKLRKTHM